MTAPALDSLSTSSTVTRYRLAIGRAVRKGEKSIPVATLRPIQVEERDPSSGESRTRTINRPWLAYVFHECQTEPAKGARK